MKIELQSVLPEEIETRSFEIISAELGDFPIAPENEAVIKRVIHTTADFDYVKTLIFSPDAVQKGIEALREGVTIVTDTQMVLAGINKTALGLLGGEAFCYISEEGVAKKARQDGTTRSQAAVDHAAALGDHVIYAVGNAPTALIRLYEKISEGVIHPRLVIGVPVGFVNALESKELILDADVPYIVSRGRKGGSNVAAAICNALLYAAVDRRI